MVAVEIAQKYKIEIERQGAFKQKDLRFVCIGMTTHTLRLGVVGIISRHKNRSLLLFGKKNKIKKILFSLPFGQVYICLTLKAIRCHK